MSNSLLLDLILKSVVNASGFNPKSEETWDLVQQLCPGTSLSEVKNRYAELIECPPEWMLNSRYSSDGTSANKPRDRSIETGEIVYRPSSTLSSKRHVMKEEIGHDSEIKAGLKPLGSRGPTMVIHVCDEAKGVKQDFHCPRDLLVEEMKYFAEYLSSDQQRWEEVDISVHCDVQIFDWLMRYVKRTAMGEVPDKLGALEPSNVVSILISSDFLKMDTLVEECIEYCHENMTAILATPCNMNCINDKLVARIADKFTEIEADAVKDRKDKFKSKIFMKKIERLFDPNYKPVDTNENMSSLYKCASCNRLLTRNTERRVRCTPSRMTIDAHGELAPRHLAGTSWDINDYLVELRGQVASWREVYWRLWGVAHVLTCLRCGEVFPCSELGHCRYHPQQPVFGHTAEQSLSKVEGVFACCGLKTLRFDCVRLNKGCQVRDHLITQSESTPLTATGPQGDIARARFSDILLERRDIITIPFKALDKDREETVDLFASEQLIMDQTKRKTILSDDAEVLNSGASGPRLEPLTLETDFSEDELSSGGSDDEIGDDEPVNVRLRARPRNRITVQPEAILVDAPQFLTKKAKKWDGAKSLRANQDAQRQEDLRRMKQIVEYLTKLRLNIDKNEKSKPKEFAAGIYARLEAQWRMQHCPPVAKIPPLQSLRGKQKLGAQFTPFR